MNWSYHYHSKHLQTRYFLLSIYIYIPALIILLHYPSYTQSFPHPLLFYSLTLDDNKTKKHSLSCFWETRKCKVLCPEDPPMAENFLTFAIQDFFHLNIISTFICFYSLNNTLESVIYKACLMTQRSLWLNRLWRLPCTSKVRGFQILPPPCASSFSLKICKTGTKYQYK